MCYTERKLIGEAWERGYKACSLEPRLSINDGEYLSRFQDIIVELSGLAEEGKN